MKMGALSLILFCVWIQVVLSEGDEPLPRRQFMKSLYDGYCSSEKCPESWALPNDTVHVSFGIALIDIVHFNADSGVGYFHMWERYLWKDPALKWNPDEYSGIDHIRTPIFFWKPDMVLYNGFDARSTIREEVNSVISFDGSVLWIPMVTHTVRCSTVDNKTFICQFKFGSWTFDGFSMPTDFYDNLEDIDIDDYVEATDRGIHLKTTSAVRNVKYYPCCKEPYIDLTFSLEIIVD